jgi:hypothetical protein
VVIGLERGRTSKPGKSERMISAAVRIRSLKNIWGYLDSLLEKEDRQRRAANRMN